MKSLDSRLQTPLIIACGNTLSMNPTLRRGVVRTVTLRARNANMPQVVQFIKSCDFPDLTASLFSARIFALRKEIDKELGPSLSRIMLMDRILPLPLLSPSMLISLRYWPATEGKV